SLRNARLAGYDRKVPSIQLDLVQYYSENRQLPEAAAVLDSMERYPGGAEPEVIAANLEMGLAAYREALGMELLAGRPVPTDLLEAGRDARELLADAAKFLAEGLENSGDLRALYLDNQRLGAIYQALGDHKASAERYRRSLQYKDTLAVNQAQFLLKQYERDQELATRREADLRLANERQKQQFRFYSTLAAGGGLFLLAIGLWSRLRYTRRTNAIITREKERSEELLLNILPEEVAEELKEKGEADARLIEQATVLFTDFKGFTAYSEKMSPQQLVKDLHLSFTAFDEIIARHGMEKIKTIVDAYMAAGGLPTPNTTHATDVIKAALAMRDFIAEGKRYKLEKGLPYFEIRIGIHTGPVVAGIVGVKKFSYDIWGDTVNTASRMESSGEVGQVNISEATYALVKNESGLTFTPRGKVQAKGKGEMEMYFVHTIA
ncbi:MAG: adenylate/guanylate cyclase domain-containing protein, partial [Flavobacteriales bacterium]|nr:adenylate/guanylate cyclase domain-containing protein [Flavobacteriales bacterium]